jgi:hypothetical protein
VLNSWLGSKIIATVDAAGALAVADVYVVPAWKPLNNGNAAQLHPCRSRPSTRRGRSAMSGFSIPST